MMLGVRAALVVAACIAAASAESYMPNTKPNIIFILADDLGYNEVGYQNETRGLHTPALDSLAKDAVRLKHYYVQPICSPTRSALMTGRYTIRLGTQSSVIYWDTPWGISLNETFMPEKLKELGYNTAMYGKWHLGMYKKEYMPYKRGFDDHQGYLQGCGSAYTHVAACCSAGSPNNDTNYVCKGGKVDYRGYDWFHNGDADPSANHTNSATLIRDAAVKFIHNTRDPFFLYLPFQNVHGPHTCDLKYYDMYANRTDLTSEEITLFGYITELDYAVADVIAALKETKAYDNSVIIFSSDNGAPPDGNADHQHGEDPGYIARNYPFRGWKTQIWEGGTRVAGFVHSPLLPAAAQNKDSTELFHVTDWWPTVVALAGGSDMVDKQNAGHNPLDGHNIWPSLAHGAPSPRTEMLYNINPLCHGGQADVPKAALRVGKYKLMSYCYSIAGIDGATTTGPVKAPKGTKGVDPEFMKGPVLYDLEADPTESTNVAEQNPNIVQQLLARLETFAENSVLPMQWTPPYQGPDYACAKCPTHPNGKGPGVPWGPWL